MLPGETERHTRFLRVFTAHEMAIRAYVRRLVPSRADADDVMQEVAVVLWEKFATFRENGDFRAWAFGIARYEVLSWRRDKGRDRLVLDDDVLERLAEETVQEEPRLHLQRQALEGCLAKMNAGQRDLLMLAYEEASPSRPWPSRVDGRWRASINGSTGCDACCWSAFNVVPWGGSGHEPAQ